MPVDPRAPCLIGVAHHTWHPDDVGPDGAPEPLEMWHEVATAAARDAGSPDAITNLEQIEVVYCQAWQYDDPAGRLAERLGAKPARAVYSGIGGSVPQTLAAGASRSIIDGDLDLALIVGGEALATKRRLKKQGRKPEWSYRPTEKRPFPFDIPFHPAEVAHSIFEAYLTFALFDNARRGYLAVGLDDYRAAIGRELGAMTEVAASNPDAWFPIRRSAKEIVTPTADNRLVAYPYTKLMTSIMDIDMAAALLLASHAKADQLGVPLERRVYLRGWGYAQDPAYVAERRDLWRSPAMKAASQAALAPTGLGVDDVELFDLYSCFGSSIAFARDALGLRADDSRPITVTGGLPYHGGPGSSYMTHSIGTMAQRLREQPSAFGLVSGVGMHMTKHAYGLWSAQPPSDMSALRRGFDRDVQAEADRELGVAPIEDRYSGPATVATYSVLHGREGTPEWGALVCDIPGGARCYGRLDDTDTLANVERKELIGRTVQLHTTNGGANIANLD